MGGRGGVGCEGWGGVWGGQSRSVLTFTEAMTILYCIFVFLVFPSFKKSAVSLCGGGGGVDLTCLIPVGSCKWSIAPWKGGLTVYWQNSHTSSKQSDTVERWQTKLKGGGSSSTGRWLPHGKVGISETKRKEERNGGRKEGKTEGRKASVTFCFLYVYISC